MLCTFCHTHGGPGIQRETGVLLPSFWGIHIIIPSLWCKATPTQPCHLPTPQLFLFIRDLACDSQPFFKLSSAPLRISLFVQTTRPTSHFGVHHFQSTSGPLAMSTALFNPRNQQFKRSVPLLILPFSVPVLLSVAEKQITPKLNNLKPQKCINSHSF